MYNGGIFLIDGHYNLTDFFCLPVYMIVYLDGSLENANVKVCILSNIYLRKIHYSGLAEVFLIYFINIY